MDSAEGELESFRRQWRQEVSERTKGRSGPAQAAQLSGAIKRSSKGSTAAPQAKNDVRDQNEGADDFEGRTFHDLEDKEELLKLGNEAQRAKAVEGKEPKTALEHYEKAVERETQGILQDSVNLYRKAFKVCLHYLRRLKGKRTNSCGPAYDSSILMSMRHTRQNTFHHLPFPPNWQTLHQAYLQL